MWSLQEGSRCNAVIRSRRHGPHAESGLEMCLHLRPVALQGAASRKINKDSEGI